MKSKIKSGIKIYIALILFVLVVCFCYTFYLSKTQKENNLIIELLIGGVSFLILGLFYGNAVHKKGLFVGIGTAILHLGLIKLIIFLSTGTFHLDILQISIMILCSGIGGILGICFKKIF